MPVRLVIAAALLFNLLGMFFVTVVAMHRVAGPVFNLLRQFQLLARGDFSVVARFRTTDEMHYVARRFNEMVMMLRVRNDFVIRKVDEAVLALETGHAEEAKTALESIREMRRLEKKSCE
jgi:nitrate/nitrite-specific signal transduction histidine kinase